MRPLSIFLSENQASIRSLLAALTLGSLLTACDSLDNPLRNVASNIGRDARVYNSNTGSYEWPDDLASQQKQKREQAALAAMPKATPAPPKTEARKTDAEKQRLAQVKNAPSAPRKAESTPAPALTPPPSEFNPSAPAPPSAPSAPSPADAPLFPQ